MENELYQSLSNTLYAVGGVVGVGLFVVLLLFLMSKKWFWFSSAGFIALAFAYLAIQCLIEQRFLGALIYVFLIWVCWSLTGIAIKYIPHTDEQGYPEQSVPD
jgi:mannose/fructose/N-acetylgalactosamine-specific phosphotransferase system component IIC